MVHFVLQHDPNIGDNIAGYIVNDARPEHGRLSLTTSDGVRVWANYTVKSPTGRQMGFEFMDVNAAVVEVFH